MERILVWILILGIVATTTFAQVGLARCKAEDDCECRRKRHGCGPGQVERGTCTADTYLGEKICTRWWIHCCAEDDDDEGEDECKAKDGCECRTDDCGPGQKEKGKCKGKKECRKDWKHCCADKDDKPDPKEDECKAKDGCECRTDDCGPGQKEMGKCKGKKECSKAWKHCCEDEDDDDDTPPAPEEEP